MPPNGGSVTSSPIGAPHAPAPTAPAPTAPAQDPSDPDDDSSSKNTRKMMFGFVLVVILVLFYAVVLHHAPHPNMPHPKMQPHRMSTFEAALHDESVSDSDAVESSHYFVGARRAQRDTQSRMDRSAAEGQRVRKQALSDEESRLGMQGGGQQQEE